MPTRLSDEERQSELAGLPGWSMAEGREAITRSYIFIDFNEAFGWMTRLAMIAEQMNHHPEWSNVYSRVDVTLATHSVDGLSALDIKLAKHMNLIAAQMRS